MAEQIFLSPEVKRYVIISITLVLMSVYFLCPEMLLLTEQNNKCNDRDRPAMLCWGNIAVSRIFVTTSWTIIAGTFKVATVQKSVN